MNRQKKLFLILSAIFLLLLGYIGYDISRRTTFPGRKPHPEEQTKQAPASPDITGEHLADSLSVVPEKP